MINDVKTIKPKVISLFSGCGGLDLGFVQAGCDIVYANDFDKHATAVYELNFGEGTVDKRDIRIVEADEIPDGDILIAGFPCQPFSTAGKRKGVADPRGQLYKECIRIIKAKKPKVVLFENVRGIFSSKDRNGRTLGDTITKELLSRKCGYTVTSDLILASDYGVPQNRTRAFIVGVRKDIKVTYEFPPKQSKEGLTVGDVLSLPQDAPNQQTWKFTLKAADIIPLVPEGGSWHDVPYEHLPERLKKVRDKPKKVYSTYYRRFARHEINGTITAAANPELCGITHPTENRRYTIREVARFQSFPDDFLFIDGIQTVTIAMYRVIGNAVPPVLAKCLAESIIKQVFDK